MNKNITILSRDGKFKGHYTGGSRVCRLEGCRGQLQGVRWNDGKLTFPCSSAIVIISNNTHKIS